MEIRIRQFGGHLGSFAGDCALIEIESGADSRVVVIDTGASKVWTNGTEFKKWVNGALPKRAQAERTLITTHFHADHYDGDRHGSVTWSHWFHGQSLKTGVGGGTLVRGRQVVHTGRDDGWTYFVECYAPDWTQGGPPGDENDCSLAVAVYASNDFGGFSFLSFGDMTKDGEARCALFFPVSVAKFPHHGSPDNFLKYFTYGVSDHILISGDSGNAATTVKALLDIRRDVSIYVLARTREAVEKFKMNWEAACTLDASLLTANVKLGSDMVVDWTSGDTIWGGEPTYTHEGGLYLRVQTKQVTQRRQETSNVWTKQQ